MEATCGSSPLVLSRISGGVGVSVPTGMDYLRANTKYLKVIEEKNYTTEQKQELEARMEILTAVATKIVEFTVEPIVKQMGYLLCYRNNLKELKNQANELQATKERIDHKVEAERRNGREIQCDVLQWQESVIKSLEEAKKLYEDPHDAKLWCSPNLKSRYQHGRKAKKMVDTIAEMKGKGKFDEGVGYVPHLDITKNLPAIRGSDGLESRKSVKEDVMLSLKDPKVNKIGVYGIGGVGKTTLVQEIAKQVKDDKLFATVVMVTVSQTNLERIQDEIAEQLGLHTLKEITSIIGRAYCLCERIKKEKTILIILDDLWERIDLDRLGIPFLNTWGKMNLEKVGVPLKDDYKGCKLLLTSRSKHILQKNDAQKKFSLQVLNDEESWSLFEALVGDVVKDDNFRKIATQVTQRCVGLPVLIVTIAKSLKYNKDIYYWNDTLQNLKRVDSGDMKEIVFSALEFNFNRLEDEVKEVFLLCGVNGTSIHVSDLLKYAIGLGMFKYINTIEDARNRLYRIIYDLKASCLLVDDDARAEIIKMHDIVHEVAVSMASGYAFTKIDAKLQDWPRKDILERCTHIILYCCSIQKLPERLDCPHLIFLHINSTDNHTLEIPNSFFEGMRNLEALDLTGMTIVSLPISLRSLTKLKTLCLDQCSLKDMTGIGALMNLEILSLIHSSVEEFPREIQQLTKLRMLDLSRSGIGTTLPNILCKLTKIEELYMGDATINWEVESLATQKRNASLAKLGDLTGLTTLELQIREAYLLPKDIAFEKLERYKVVIGDKWEWSDNKTPRLLKVKLDTSIHWEQGIKTLIKRVEDLYLDNISGISNVLFELNGEGFPLLRHLHIQNNGEIQHIVNSMKRNLTHVLFPELETMILHNLNSLVKICHSPVRGNSFGKLKVVKVRSCDQLVYLFSTSMVKAFSQLVEIEVSECISMKKIMSVESIDSDEKIEFLPLRSLTLQNLPIIDYFCSHELTSSLGTTENLSSVNISTPFFSAEVKFSNLETLKLSSVYLKNIWDDSSAPYLVHNLANLTIEDCSGLKYLFSSSVVGRLSNLKQLEVSKCDMMEEIIATEEINGVAVGEVLFPKLEAIIIKDMQNLKTIWHLILASNSLACLKTLDVKNCEKIEKIVPEYMNGAFATLETLKVEECKSVQEIFQLGDNADDKPQLKYITLLRLPQLKQIWSRDPESSHCFKSLQLVLVEDCGQLEYLFPFSIAEHLPQLEAITIKNAEKMKEIVSKREEPLDNVVNFEFDQLTSMVLWNLQDLRGFVAGNHSLSCSSLKQLDVYNCQKLKLFKTQGTCSQERLSDDHLHVTMQQPLFTLQEVIENLESLSLNNEDASMIFQSQVPRDRFSKLNVLVLYELQDAKATCPYWFLQNISSLEELVIQENYFKVIFPDERPRYENGEIEINTRLTKLTLYKLYELEHLCKEECQLDPVLDLLEFLEVDECSNLKHLVPSSVTFNLLTCLEVQNCNGLIYLITSPTARSLVNLRTLKIIKCDLVEQIVEEAGGESICEIAFRSLKVLELESLPKLKMFCSGSICCLKLPVLEKLVIRQCARMESFSASDTITPLLQEILTDEQDKIWFCEGDLNNIVNKMFHDKVAFSNFNYLEFSKYPELKQLWYGQDEQKIFCNLKHLVVHKCTFLPNMLFSSNLLQLLYTLEELEVTGCESLEAVFDVKALNDKAMESKGVSGLKILTLSGLPNLIHIWNREAGEIISFENLQIVKVDKCPNLKYVFSPSLCQELRQLEELHIWACGVENIVANEEGFEELKFYFPLLRIFMLGCLMQVNDFYPKRYTLECPSLKVLNVDRCEALQIFTFGQMDSQQHRGVCVDLPIQQALFHVEKVSEDLEELSLNEKDARTISNGNYEKKLFQRMKILRLQCFQETPGKFLNALIQKFPSITTLQTRCSSFETLFFSKQFSHCSVGNNTQIKNLWLFQLEQLEHIWNDDDSASHPLVQNLEVLSMLECSRITRLAPPSTSFKNLTYLEARNCNGLMYFLTTCTAKSLIHLTDLIVDTCGKLEEVLGTDDEGQSKEEITFESLKYLELNFLSSFKSFCSGKISTLIFPSLVTLKVIGCPRMQNFSSGVIIAPFLKLVEVENGKKYWKEDLNTTIMQLFIDKVAFSYFTHLEFSKYPELKQLWYGQDGQKIFCNLKHLVVHKCTFLSNMLFSSNLLQLLYTLEELEVAGCESLEAVFDVKALNDKAMESKGVSGLKILTLSGLPNLIHIWNREAGEIISFGNLRIVKVDRCPNLKYVFSPSLCQGLRQLEELNIGSCGVENIVANEEGFEELKFYFPLLRIFRLGCLMQVNDFYPKRYTLECPSLKILDVDRCGALQIFTFGQMDFQQHRGVCVDLSIQQTLFHIEKVSKVLEELSLNELDARRILNGNYEEKLFQRMKILRLQYFQETPTKFLNDLIQNFPAITTLQMRCSSFETLFFSKEFGHCSVGNTTQIKKLWLFQLEQLEHIWNDDDSASHLLVQNLEVLSMWECSRIIRLAPPSTSFKNLTYLDVRNCNGLMYFMTTYTGKSLIHLKWLKVSNCGMLEEVVVTDDGGKSKGEITFESLKYLELNFLSSFKSFCSGKISTLIFPCLVTLKVIGCPRMRNFSSGVISAPFLKLVEVENGKKCWKENLNTTIKQLFIDKVAFRNFNRLEFSKYPELKQLWYGQDGQKIFCNLKHLVVHKCTFLSNMLFSSNLLQLLYTLEELEVTGCESLEAVFDVKVLNDKAMESKGVSGLKKLTVSGLPNLKHIWNKEVGEIISFGNLQIVEVDACPNLKYVFSPSLCQELSQLEELHIESCGVENIVANEEGFEELKFYFPLLRIFRLIHLMQVNDFYSKRYTLECPSLKILNIGRCDALQIFTFGQMDSLQLRGICVDLPIQQALFHIEKVSENLEELSLNEKDAKKILNGNYEKRLFQRTKILRLQYFQETPAKFLNDLMQKFPATTTFQMRYSSFETLFFSKEFGHCSVGNTTQIKNLWLFQLEQLEHIWNDDDSASHPLFQNLEVLSMGECSRITRLAPPSTSFKNLTDLEVRDCNGLMYFMTTCTAKSLIHLKWLKVSNCGMLEEVVVTDDGGKSKGEITFESLKYLELNFLSYFKSFCSGKISTLIFPSLVTLKVIGCPRMQNFSSGVIIAPFLKLVEVENGKKHWKEDLNTTIKQLFINKAKGEGVEGDCKESSSINIENNQTHQKCVNTSRALSSDKSKTYEIVNSGKQENHKLPTSHTGIGIQNICEITETTLDQASQNTLKFTKVDGANGTDEMNETIQTVYFQAVESSSTHTSVQETALGTRDETIQRHLVQATHQCKLSPSIVLQDTEKLHSVSKNQEMYRTLEKALVPVVQNVLINVERPLVLPTKIAPSPVYDAADGSQDLELHLSENLQGQATTTTMNDEEENTGTKEMHETIQRALVQNAEDTLIFASVQDIATGIHVTHESIVKPLVHATQNAWDIAIVQNKEEELYNSDIHLSKNLFNQSITSMAADYRETVGTQDTYKSKRRLSGPDAQNVLSPIMVYDTVVGPAPSQASEANSSSTTPIADICSSFKELDRLLPYLEAGVKCHPQVLNWLNTEQRRVFASSIFSLFAEVTHILRTTRRGHLTEGDRNYITKCCTVLEVVGFDASWLSYVYKSIEECGDNAEDIKRKVEETKVQASSLEAQLESIKKELTLLLDKASRLDDFIES